VGGADTRGWANTRGSADSVSGASGVSDITSRSHSVSQEVADSETWGESASEAKLVGLGYSAGSSHGTGFSEVEGVSLGAGRLFSGGLSVYIVPGMSLSRNWQTEDDMAICLTEVTRWLELLLTTASHEDGFMIIMGHREFWSVMLVPVKGDPQ